VLPGEEDVALLHAVQLLDNDFQAACQGRRHNLLVIQVLACLARCDLYRTMSDERTIARAVDLLQRAAPGATIIVFGSYARGNDGAARTSAFLGTPAGAHTTPSMYGEAHQRPHVCVVRS